MTNYRVINVSEEGYTLNPVQQGIEVLDDDGNVIEEIDLTGSPIHVPPLRREPSDRSVF